MYLDGGRILSADGKSSSRTSRKALSALQKIADLALVHKVTPPDYGTVDQAGVRAQFKDRKSLAMLMSTPASSPTLRRRTSRWLSCRRRPARQQAGDERRVRPLRRREQRRQGQGEAAHELAKYLTGSQVAKDIPAGTRARSRRRTPVTPTNDNRGVISKLVEYGVYEAPVATSAELGSRYGAALQSIIRQANAEAGDGRDRAGLSKGTRRVEQVAT